MPDASDTLSLLTRRGLLTFFAGSLASAACAQADDRTIRPEAFGAAGNGVRDDATAFAAAFAASAGRGLPVTLTAGARYRLGAAGWSGLRLASGLAIEGNGATLLAAALPRQEFVVGAGNPLIRVDGGVVAIRNVNFDLGRLPVAALALDRCRLAIQGCSFAGGQVSNQSFGLYLNRCSGVIRNNNAHDIGHAFYVGHTDAGMGSHDLNIAGNRGNALAADFVVGVLRDSLIENNQCTGMYSGVALAALALTGSFCENVIVRNNTFSNFRGQGIQTDIVGEIRDRNIRVLDNVLRAGGRNSAGIYLLRIDGFELLRNRIEQVDYGIVVDAARDGLIQQNQIIAGTRSRARAIGLVGQHGEIRGIRILGNRGSGFPDGIMLEGQRGGVSDIEISGNELGGGDWGVRATAGVSAVRVHNNVFRGNRTRDVTVGRGVTAYANRSAR
jgi:hypothetical protein